MSKLVPQFPHRPFMTRIAPGLPALLLAAAFTPGVLASEPAAAPVPAQGATVQGGGKAIANQVRDAMSHGDATQKKLNLIIDRKSTAAGAAGAPAAEPQAVAPHVPPRGLVIRTRTAKPAKPKHDIHWSYEGEGGPAHWGSLKAEYETCAKGQRQSPIHIEDSFTLKGPAEALQFDYRPSKGTVANNGHTVQVNVYGDNTLTVRGTTYLLIQFHFHHPAEERINHQGFPMVAHLVHRNDLGQLAVVAVLLEPGEANPLIDRVWTHMPLDANDSVRMPPDLVDLNLILPKDQRYYQFLGSLTTPPCTEGVLWMVMKQPVSLSAAQLKLFGQLYPNNARPVQPVHGRPVRDAVRLPTSSTP